MGGLLRLLGIAPRAAAEAVGSALARIPGPAIGRFPEGDCIAFAQSEPPGPRSERQAEATRLRALQLVQRRLEAACLAGPFLPASPAAALCPAAELPALLAAAAPRLQIALAEDAGTHQWQLTLRWPRERLMALRHAMIAHATEDAAGDGALPGPAGLAAAEEAALRDELAYRAAVLEAALAPAVRRLQRQGAEPLALRYLLLVPRDGEAAIEAVLRGLAPAIARGAMADLQGPMPPVHFHAWQVAEAEEQALRAAWALLGLPERVELAALRRCGRPAPPPPVPDRGLAALFPGAELETLLPRARRRLIPCGSPRDHHAA
ncbi:GvpL/GvpF family gas vesicle protein [Roseomonas sp. 18066]|uniref:GvpL/GvpF family gas vesicle protein n=1 Tax=Roseomonas sp. 18066 TaxID=2681412 RepID=UPI0013576718|nr:GvpL/GvpF family gas vesicle protein [Roseomonas sp. 18066]